MHGDVGCGSEFDVSIYDDLQALQTLFSLIVSKIKATNRFYTLAKEDATPLLQSRRKAFEAA